MLKRRITQCKIQRNYQAFNICIQFVVNPIFATTLHQYTRKIKIKRGVDMDGLNTSVSSHFSHPSLLILLSHSCFLKRPLNLSIRLKAPRYWPSRVPCFVGRMLWRETTKKSAVGKHKNQLIKTFWLVLMLSKFQVCLVRSWVYI